MTATTDTRINPDAIAYEAERRSAYTSGLRALADALDADADLPLPYVGASPTYGQFSVFAETKAQVAKFARLFQGRSDKEVTDDANYGFQLVGAVHGLHLRVYAPRDAVCERVVTGTREVTEEIPDPVALAAVPTVTVTKTVEDVRWDCKPLLAEVEPVAS